MKLQNKQAFTLVELIVTITILAILATIAFISFTGYSQNSRDSKRIADINSIQKSLELYITEKGTYPIPDNNASITYSGAIAWIEGTVGDGVIINIESINKKPIDPLTENEYTYSVTSSKTEYQLGAISEGGTIGYELPINQTYAATAKKGTAMIRGTYNERYLKVQSGTINWILALPSIIATDITQTDIQTILNNKKLVYNSYNNIPHSYNNAGYIMTGGFDYTNTNPLVYSGSMKTLTDSNDEKKIFISGLKSAYNGTILQGDANYKDIVNSDIATNSTGAINTVISLINSNVGGLRVSNTILPLIGVSGTTETPSVVQWKDIPGTNCTNDDYVFTLAGTTYRWAGCNSVLGTTGISTNADVYNGPCYNYAGGITTTNCNSTYLTYTAKENLFNEAGEDNIWGKLYLRANAVQANNACPTGWHLPTDLEFEKLETHLNGDVNCRNSTDLRLCDGLGWAGKSGKTDQNNIIKALKLPLAGRRISGSFVSLGDSASLWSFTEYDTTNARMRLLYRIKSSVYRNSWNMSTNALSVRCIKD